MTEEFSINNEQMGKRIRELREKEGLTQDALSEILSVGPNVIGCYERGEYGPSKKTLRLIVSILVYLQIIFYMEKRKMWKTSWSR